MEEDEAREKINKDYLKHYQSHVRDTAAHLDGTDYGRGSLQPSYFPPSGYWSPAEKNSFFHALRIHSRLRPDLIAAEIPGKTVVDVCVYLDLLAEAAAETPVNSKRSSLPSALEVSDEWVDFEEEQATIMAKLEPIWEADKREENRAELLHAEKLAMCKRRGEGLGGTRDRQGEKRRNVVLAEIRARQEAEWEKEDYMGDLGVAQLRAIDSILREAEESNIVDATSCDDMTSERDSFQVSGAEAPQAAMSDPTSNVVLHDHSIQAAYSLGSQDLKGSNSTQVTRTADESSRDNPVGDTGIDHVNLETVTLKSPREPTGDSSSLSPTFRRRYQKRLHMRHKRATQAGREVPTAMTRLKPGRKTNKTSLREQKRQSERSDEVDLGIDACEELNLDETRFTTPANANEKEEYSNVSEGKEVAKIPLGAEPENPLDTPMKDGQQEFAKSRPRVAGRTLPYRIKDEVLGFGYDASVLKNEGLDLFHLSNLADLMHLHVSLQGASNDVGTRLSGPLIKLLRAEVINFVTDLMSRAIAVHDQECLSKEHTKVWRLRDKKIRISAIHRALETMSAAKDKKARFASLIDRMTHSHQRAGLSGREEDIEEAVEQGAIPIRIAKTSDEGAVEDWEDDASHNSDEVSFLDIGGDEASIAGFEPPMSPDREIYTPFIWHPSLDHLVPRPYLSFEESHAPEYISSDLLHASGASDLLDELLEEEELDVADVAAARKMEAELRSSFGLGPRVFQELEQTVADPSPILEPVHPKRSRSMKRRTTKRIKSSVYVEDSE